MTGHSSADEAVALSLLVLSSPFLAQLFDCLHAPYLLLGQFPLVSLATTAGGFPHPRPGAFGIFCILVEHVALFAVFDGHKGFGPASAVESFFDEGGIHALFLNSLLDVLNVFVLLVGSTVFF